MSTPQNSTGPVPLEEHDAWGAGGITSFVKGIRDAAAWIRGLSPAGATKYDSGPLALEFPSAEFEAYGGVYTTPQAQRFGRVIYVWGLIRAVNGLPSGGTAAIGKLPAGIPGPTATEIMRWTVGPATRPTGAASATTTGSTTAGGTAHTHSIAHTHPISLSGVAMRGDIRPDGTITLNLSSTDTLTAGSYLSLSGNHYIV